MYVGCSSESAVVVIVGECMAHGSERSIEDAEESEAVQQEETLDPWLCLERAKQEKKISLL